MATLTIALILTAAGNLRAQQVVLTEDVLQRYLAIFPTECRITKDLEDASKMPEGDAKDKKIQDIQTRKTNVLKSHGWQDSDEFQAADARIVQGITPLNILQKFANMPADTRKQVEDSVAEQMKDFKPEEIAALKKYLARLIKIRQDAGLLPK